MALSTGPVDPAIFAQLAEIAQRNDTYVLIHVGRSPHGDPGLVGSVQRIASADLAIIRGQLVKFTDPGQLDALTQQGG
jgi:hypothetical protein